MIWRVAAKVMAAGFWAVQVICQFPPVNRIADRVLDTILDPAEDFEYVSTTTPVEPPPY